MISGYVCYREVDASFEYRLKKYLMLWLQVFVYSFVLTLIIYLIKFPTFKISAVIQGLFPVSTLAYWYFTEYTALFFLMPYINRLIRNLDRVMLNRLGIICLVILPLYNQLSFIFTNNDLFYINGGYSFIWLVVLCVIGVWIKVNNLADRIKAIYAVCLWAGSSLLMYLSVLLLNDTPQLSFLSSPTVMLQAFALMIMFLKLGKRINHSKVITFAAPAAFGVYLIHENVLFRKVLLDKKFVWIAKMSPIPAFFVLIGIALLIFTVCLLIEKIRIKLFYLFHVEKFLNIFLNHRRLL